MASQKHKNFSFQIYVYTQNLVSFEEKDNRTNCREYEARNSRNTALWCVCLTITAVENSKYLAVSVATVGHPNAHAPYGHLWPVRLYHISPQCLITGTIFEKKVIQHKLCLLIFCTRFAWNFSYSKKNSERYYDKRS
jgi:hypothetical protein